MEKQISPDKNLDSKKEVDEIKKLPITDIKIDPSLKIKESSQENIQKKEESIKREKKEEPEKKEIKPKKKKKFSLTYLEKKTLKRINRKEKKEEKKEIKTKSSYAQVSSKFFSKFSKDLLGKESFQILEQDLVKAGIDFTPTGYISLILFSTFISSIVGGFIFLFFLFFNFGATMPIIARATDPINIRFVKVFWILFLVPIGTFFMMYIYPNLEKRSEEIKIDVELPFAVIHMAAISSSMINPVRIFEILIQTKEYPALGKQFTKLLNEINIYGSDLVNALKNTSKNSPSKKLSELLNGLSTTINSGGDLSGFFEKRSQTLLFDHKIEMEKESKAAETFMDIYISVVIAAPMIIMLLLMMMKLSGLGISMSVNGITTLMVLGVVVINIIFLTFLQLKRKA